MVIRRRSSREGSDCLYSLLLVIVLLGFPRRQAPRKKH